MSPVPVEAGINIKNVAVNEAYRPVALFHPFRKKIEGNIKSFGSEAGQILRRLVLLVNIPSIIYLDHEEAEYEVMHQNHFGGYRDLSNQPGSPGFRNW
jgi:hypothetical protein